ncbi:UDP-N-acetylglucosamine 2-epimerase (non-hydrolyzing) [Victivallaceae bacterium BBE-744-WT-12]|uniref:UDP-N-acetylglucosamine 2-epimerase (Non-hydrolyzing) n=1 Tax=Victivallis lenta TaxID=2606640 RepID=A0A844G0G3_9BACT|nr:UDP-N-acetylglucosamine 2-epimerase (non-hydrolyzing) [Victivallis lenta]MST96846.1 UDP-N-acetylglucosamine 2-epimerase (non-hydrolyzing) [Victivallis lenta]
MRIITIVGARPQFIKAAILSRALRGCHEEILIHTGQHFDANMSTVFFDELEISAPKYNLGISGETHGVMTGKMLIAIEEVLVRERPDAVLLYGDTNSTVAGALAAVKLRIPLIHVEAGNRLGTLDNPEEVNRITTDHLSTLLFCASDSAKSFLDREGLGARAYTVGNVMYDAFLYFGKRAAEQKRTPVDYNSMPITMPDRYCYLTCHRAENTSDEALTEIFRAVSSLDYPTIYPVHPRNRERALRIGKSFPKVILIPPVGYLESVRLTGQAERIVTDSGGLQCEAFYAGVPCVTVFHHVVWPETLAGNRNQMAPPVAAEIMKKFTVVPHIDPEYRPFGDGHACQKIVKILNEKLNL